MSLFASPAGEELAEVRVDDRDHDVDVGDTAVGGPGLGSVDHPLVLGLVVDGTGAQRAHVGAGVGLGHAVGAELHLVGVDVERGDGNAGRVWLQRLDGVKGQLVSVHVVGKSVAKQLRYTLPEGRPLIG